MCADKQKQTHLICTFCWFNKFQTAKKLKAAQRPYLRCLHSSYTGPQLCQSCCHCELVNVLLFFYVMFLFFFFSHFFPLLSSVWIQPYFTHPFWVATSTFLILLPLFLLPCLVKCLSESRTKSLFFPLCHKQVCSYLASMIPVSFPLIYYLLLWTSKAPLYLCHKHPLPTFYIPSSNPITPLMSSHLLHSFAPHYWTVCHSLFSLSKCVTKHLFISSEQSQNSTHPPTVYISSVISLSSQCWRKSSRWCHQASPFSETWTLFFLKVAVDLQVSAGHRGMAQHVNVHLCVL